ncbi:MAG: hypothetical protein EOM24_04475 [Chloroflexia bacterium]|nr:hypothetical protein [Chloroflexia bacterium]
MPSQPICPCCRSPQATQRVAAIVTGGTRDVRVLTADLVPAAGVARTHLAQLLAPPREPGGGWWIIVVLVGLLFFSVPASCLVTLLIVNLQGAALAALAGPAYAEHLFAGVASVGALLAVGLTGRCIQRDEQRRRAANERWQRQVARWQQAWYCHRCHVAFVAGSAEAVVPEQFGRLFRT